MRDVCIRVLVFVYVFMCVRARYEKEMEFHVSFLLLLEEKIYNLNQLDFSILPFIFIRAAHIEAYENLYHPVIGIRCRKTLIHKILYILLVAGIPKGKLSLSITIIINTVHRKR